MTGISTGFNPVAFQDISKNASLALQELGIEAGFDRDASL